MTREEAIAAGIIAGTNMVLATVVRQLDAAGIVAQAQFADELDRAADEAERTASGLEAVGRVDLFMMRSLAKRLRVELAPAWKPTVINGAKAR